MALHYFRIEVSSPASVANLGAGFDCLALSLSLRNTYVLYADLGAKGEDEVSFAEHHEGFHVVDADEQKIFQKDHNWFWHAFDGTRRQLAEAAGVPTPTAPFFIRQVVNIPPTRGLGSSSASVVAGTLAAVAFFAEYYRDRHVDPMAALCQFRGVAHTERDVREILASTAFEIDKCPDNVCATLGGGLTFALEQDRAERPTLSFFRHEVADRALRCVVLVPDHPMRTAEARAALNGKAYTVDDVKFNLQRAACLVQIIAERRYDLLCQAVQDRIHQQHRADALYCRSTGAGNPFNVLSVLDKAVEAGAYGAFIAGAGSSLAALASEERADAVGAAMKYHFESLVRDDPAWQISWVQALELDNEGSTVESRHVEADADIDEWIARRAKDMARTCALHRPVVIHIDSDGDRRLVATFEGRRQVWNTDDLAGLDRNRVMRSFLDELGLGPDLPRGQPVRVDLREPSDAGRDSRRVALPIEAASWPGRGSLAVGNPVARCVRTSSPLRQPTARNGSRKVAVVLDMDPTVRVPLIHDGNRLTRIGPNVTVVPIEHGAYGDRAGLADELTRRVRADVVWIWAHGSSAERYRNGDDELLLGGFHVGARFLADALQGVPCFALRACRSDRLAAELQASGVAAAIGMAGPLDLADGDHFDLVEQLTKALSREGDPALAVWQARLNCQELGIADDPVVLYVHPEADG